MKQIGHVPEKLNSVKGHNELLQLHNQLFNWEIDFLSLSPAVAAI